MRTYLVAVAERLVLDWRTSEWANGGSARRRAGSVLWPSSWIGSSHVMVSASRPPSSGSTRAAYG